ncbi:hypothetical protein CQJ94_16745 [Glycomyces fuscus]|nr:hypothetical protein CQJ94_16745 [Glycomyces fuscus]
MVAAYGGVYHGAMSEEPSQTAYNRLAHRLLTEALSCVGRIDRVILAYALPDSQPGYSVCASIAHASPGLSSAFAVADQGSTAPFTALRIAGETFEDSPDARAMVIALDQSMLPWDSPPGTPVPERDLGVALLLEGGGQPQGGAPGPGLLLHWQTTLVDEAGAEQAVQAVLSDARARILGPLTLILGPHVPRPSSPGQGVTVRRSPSDLVCTSVWHEAHNAGMASGTAVVVVEYDPALGYFGAIAMSQEE